MTWRALVRIATLLLGAGLCTLATALEQNELRVAGTRFAQIYEIGADGAIQGLAVDLLNQLFAGSAQSLRFEILPWQRAQLMVERDEAQILVGPYRNPDRERRYLFSQQAFYEDPMLFYARRGQCQNWSGHLEQMAPGRIAVVQGWSYGDGFDQQRNRLQPATARDLDVGLKMLALGRIDWLASNERNARPLLLAMGLSEQLEACQPAFASMRGYFAFPRTAQGARLRDQLDAAMERLKRGGQLRELAQRWQLPLP